MSADRHKLSASRHEQLQRGASMVAKAGVVRQSSTSSSDSCREPFLLPEQQNRHAAVKLLDWPKPLAATSSTLQASRWAAHFLCAFTAVCSKLVLHSFCCTSGHADACNPNCYGCRQSQKPPGSASPCIDGGNRHVPIKREEAQQRNEPPEGSHSQGVQASLTSIASLHRFA